VTDTPLSASTPRAAVGFFEEETLLAVCLVFQHALNVQFFGIDECALGHYREVQRLIRVDNDAGNLPC
jgi:hypothetical protein